MKGFAVVYGETLFYFQLMITKNVVLPIVISVEENVYCRIPSIIAAKGLVFTNPLVVSGRGATKAIAEKLAIHIKTSHKPLSVKDASIDEIERIQNQIIEHGYDSLFAVGGGKAIDAGKYAAFLCGINFISIPTAVSNDGIASPVAVIENRGRTESRMTTIPTALIADLSIISKAPVSTTKSGIGDLISNLSASLDWKLASVVKKEPYDALTASMAESAAYKLIGATPLSLRDHRFLQAFIEGLIMSGTAMAIHGSSRPSSGAEHMISHAIDSLYDSPGSHGEQCGIATLFTLALHSLPIEQIKKVVEKLDLKKRPSDINLSKKEFLRAVSKAPATRPGRFSILDRTTTKEHENAYSIAFEE